MTVHRFRLAAGALFLPLALAVLPAGAEDGGLPRFEFFVRGSLTVAGTGTALKYSYDPHPGYAIPGSYARQTLQIDPLSGSGLCVGLTAFFGRTIGMRLSVSRDQSPFGGANSAFEMYYKYTAWMPTPTGFGPVDGIRNTHADWPETSGALKRTSAGLEIVVRVPIGPALSLNFSGGPLLSFFRGDILSLAYSELYYERYGALFFHTYFVRLQLPARTVVGFTGGTELSLRLDRHLTFVLSAAYRGGSYTGTPKITAAYDYNAVLEAQADVFSRIKTQIKPGPIALTPPPLVFGAGLAVIF
jgi:hypothetical protein